MLQFTVPPTHKLRVKALGETQGNIKRSKQVVSDNAKFQGLIALAEIPADTDPGEAQQRVHALAQEAGLPTDELAERRTTLAGLPAKLRNQIMELPESYSSFKEFVQHTDGTMATWTSLKKGKGGGTIVVNDVRSHVGKAPARRPSLKLMTKAEKKEQVRALMADAETQEAMAEDPEFRTDVAEAVEDARETEQSNVDKIRGYKDPMGGYGPLKKMMEIERDIRSLTDTLGETTVPSVHRDAMAVVAKQAASALEFLLSRIEAGTWDESLNTL